MVLYGLEKEQGRDLTPPYNKIPYNNKKKATREHKDTIRIFNYTTIANSWSNFYHSTGVVNIPTNRKVV